MRKFALTEECLGYVTAEDKTNTDPRHLVAGSRNVLIDKNRKVRTRNGFSRLGVANESLTPIRQAVTWQTSSDSERPMRVYDDELEVYFDEIDGTEIAAWKRVANALSTTAIPRFAPWFNDGENLDELLFVLGDDNLYRWNGAACVVSSVAATAITKTGTDTFGQARFYAVGNKTLVNIRTGTEYTYTGGESTTTLTGIADTTGIIAGDILIQKIITNTDQPEASRNNHTLYVFENQVFVGSDDDQKIYISQNDTPTDYTYSSPRVAGEGGLLTLDGPSKGFGTLGDLIIIFAGRNSIFRAEYQEIAVGSTLAETLKVKKLQTGVDQGAQSPELIVQINDALAYLSYEPALRYIQTPGEFGGINPKTLSNPVKPDFDAETWTNGMMVWYKNALYLSAPTNNREYILEFSEDADGKLRRFWQPPQTLPVRAQSIISNGLYGHSNAVPETYKLFDTDVISDVNSSDEKIPIDARAVYAYRSYGNRANLKTYDEYFVEGEITPATSATLQLLYDYGGTTQIIEKIIDGSDQDLIQETILNTSLAQQPFGAQPLGGSMEAPPDTAKFRVVFEFPKEDFYEIQPIFYTNDTDKYWSVLSHGPNTQVSARKDSLIRK